MTASAEPKNEIGLRLSLMGSEGSGKTCFFAGLAWLGGAANDSDFGIVGRDEPSQVFVNELRNTLAHHELPQSSHKTDSLALDILYRGSRIGIDIEDFAGEEFRDVGTGLKSDSPIFGKLRESRYLVLFLDIENDVERADPAVAERLDAVLNLLSIEKICDGSRKLAIVLSKSDLSGFVGPKATSDAARAHLKKHQPGLFKKIEGLGYEKRYFFLASIGRPSMSESELPTPFGYEALFGWLVDDLRNERAIAWCRRRRIPLLATAAAVLLAAGVGTGFGIGRYRAGGTLLDPNATKEEKQKALWKAPQDDVDSYIDTKIGEIREKAGSEDSLEGLKALQDEASELKGSGSQPLEQKIDQLLQDLREKREDLHLVRIKALADQKDIAKCRNAISEYWVDPDSARRRSDEVTQASLRLDDAERKRLRGIVRGAIVESGRPDSLKTRCDRVADYPYPTSSERKEADRAVAIGRLFLADCPYHVEIKSASGLPSAHRTRLELSNLGPGHMQEAKTDHQKSSSPQWNKKEEFSWKPGDRIQIEWLWSSHWGPNDTTIGKKTFSDPWTSLLDILGGVDLKPKTGAGHARLDGNTPKATIVCDEFPEPKNDLRLFRKYIVPGTYWQD